MIILLLISWIALFTIGLFVCAWFVEEDLRK